RVAATRSLPFQSYTIGPYLFDSLDRILSCVEGFQDVTQCRQAGVVDEIANHADYLIAAHWGDVWLDETGLVGGPKSIEGEMVLSHVLHKIEKPGRDWLLEKLCKPRLNGQDPNSLLREMTRNEMASLTNIEDADFRVKAFKTDQWSFRWTTVS